MIGVKFYVGVEVWLLPSLKRVSVAHNFLKRLPIEVVKRGSFRKLNICSNKLDRLPEDIWDYEFDTLRFYERSPEVQDFFEYDVNKLFLENNFSGTICTPEGIKAFYFAGNPLQVSTSHTVESLKEKSFVGMFSIREFLSFEGE